MKKLFFIVSLFVTLIVNAQNEVLFSLGDREKVTKDEFLQMFNKNATVSMENSAVEEYLNLYINYKLKLLQAYDLGMDKDSSTIAQVQDYRKSIVKPYINDTKVLDSLALEAYERLKILVRASHILISIPTNVAPEDTLQYYQKAQMIYKKALKGENFIALVDRYSEDPSATTTTGIANHGDLGYFSSMNMIYSFEQACYERIIMDAEDDTPQIKDSITFCRSNFGYHIIKLTSAVKAPFYTFNFAHIFVNAKKHEGQDIKQLIDNAYNQIATLGFDSVAPLYSDDAYSAQRGGVLSNQRANTVPAEYIDLYLKHTDGKTTQPFQTRFGWHIVKYITSVSLPDYNVLEQNIKARITKDDRGFLSAARFIAKSKDTYGYVIDSNALKQIANFLTDSVFFATWQMPEEIDEIKGKFLFSIGKQTFTCGDFIEYIFENQSNTTPTHLQTYVNKHFKSYSDNNVLDYAVENIGEMYPNVKESIEEFKRGVLIFDLTDKMIWTKSLSDSVEVEQYYEKHKSKYLYTERADAVVWLLNKDLDIKTIQKLIVKYRKKGKTNDEITDIITEKYGEKISYTWSRFEKGANNIVDKNIFNKGYTFATNNKKEFIKDTTSITNRNVIIELIEMMPISIKPLSACKGLVTSDYQEVLEKKWIEDLKEKYPVKINYELLNSIK